MGEREGIKKDADSPAQPAPRQLLAISQTSQFTAYRWPFLLSRGFMLLILWQTGLLLMAVYFLCTTRLHAYFV